jgi:hypothetical protein
VDKNDSGLFILLKRDEVLTSIVKTADHHRVRKNLEFFYDSSFDSKKNCLTLYEHLSKKVSDKDKASAHDSVSDLITSHSLILDMYIDESVIYQDEKSSLSYFISKIDLGLYAVIAFVGYEIPQKRLSKMSEVAASIFSNLRMTKVYSSLPNMKLVTSCF